MRCHIIWLGQKYFTSLARPINTAHHVEFSMHQPSKRDELFSITLFPCSHFSGGVVRHPFPFFRVRCCSGTSASCYVQENLSQFWESYNVFILWISLSILQQFHCRSPSSGPGDWSHDHSQSQTGPMGKCYSRLQQYHWVSGCNFHLQYCSFFLLLVLSIVWSITFYFGILQHGEDECYLNIIHACAINLWPDLVKPTLSDKYLTVNRNKHGEKTSNYCNLEDTIQPQNEIDLQLITMQKKHFDFIKCIEKQYKAPDRNGAEESWEACSGKLRLSTQSIKKCYNSGHGKEVWFIHWSHFIWLKKNQICLPGIQTSLKVGDSNFKEGGAQFWMQSYLLWFLASLSTFSCRSTCIMKHTAF